MPSSAVIYKGAEAFLQAVEDGKVEDRAGDARRPRRRHGRNRVAAWQKAQEVVSRAGTFVADGDMVTPVRVEETGAIKP